VRSSNDSAIDWEAELEDPRWYTDSKPTVQAQSKTKSKENIVKEYLVELTEEPPEPEAVPVKRQRCHSNPPVRVQIFVLQFLIVFSPLGANLPKRNEWNA